MNYSTTPNIKQRGSTLACVSNTSLVASGIVLRPSDIRCQVRDVDIKTPRLEAGRCLQHSRPLSIPQTNPIRDEGIWLCRNTFESQRISRTSNRRVLGRGPTASGPGRRGPPEGLVQNSKTVSQHDTSCNSARAKILNTVRA